MTVRGEDIDLVEPEDLDMEALVVGVGFGGSTVCDNESALKVDGVEKVVDEGSALRRVVSDVVQGNSVR
jgi:hypothetical protein